jgi:glycosyltransferase involved in cell wall biosynthesis
VPTYSLVVPAYNEEGVVPELAARLTALMGQLDGDAEVILVDDGSSDRTYEQMLDAARADSRFRLVRLSRNFGHQTALTAGVDVTTGDAVIVLDADLQDPPEVVLELAAKWREGYDVVYAVRDVREGETWFKRKTASWFYRGFNRISEVKVPLDVGDFRLVDRRVLDVFDRMRESNRFVRGMFSWIGLRQTGVLYQRRERFAGEKLITPVIANRSILRSGYFVSPAKRSSRRYSTPVCRSPIQLNMPRTNRLLSRIRAKTSSTRRSTSRKSPTSRGTFTSEIRLNPR